MPIKLISLTCPNCGGQLEMPVDAKDFYCQYCGSHVYTDDGSTTININQTITIRDEAALRRMDLEERKEQERRTRELERDRERQERTNPSDPAGYRKRWLFLLLFYPVSFALVFVGTAVISSIASVLFEMNTESMDRVLVRIVALYLLIGLPAWIVYVIVKRPRRKR